MTTFYDVLQELRHYGVYIHLGKRLWDIEWAGREIDHLHTAGVLTDPRYATLKVVLAEEYQREQQQQ